MRLGNRRLSDDLRSLQAKTTPVGSEAEDPGPSRGPMTEEGGTTQGGARLSRSWTKR